MFLLKTKYFFYSSVDLSLYKEESQLKKRKGAKRKASSALKVGRKPNNSAKTPDQPKVPKIAVTPTRNSANRKEAVAKKVPTTDTKKPVATSRTDRAKRRNDNQQSHNNKVSPLVDQKKARVLAKVVRKGTAANNKTQVAAKSK